MRATIGPRDLLAIPNYRRLWIAGGLGNAMRWLEMLVAAIFTFQLTHSALLVAVVTMARTMPLLLLGAVTGAIGEAVNRKLLIQVGLFTMAATSAVLCVLAHLDLVRIWHIALAGAVAGTLWTIEMSVRRRMIGEVVMAAHVGPAVALDSVTGSLTRMVGPLLGGALLEGVGLDGCYLLSTALYGTAGCVASRLDVVQVPRRLDFVRIPADIAEGLAIVRRHRVMLGVVLVTIITNAFAFSYTAVIAPLGLQRYAVSPFLVGLLAAAEPFGAVVSGLAMATGLMRMDRPRMMIGGSFMFLVALVGVAAAPWYGLAFALLLIGGLGTAAFSSMQSTLILTHAPPAMRSRVMGLVSVCIGTGPLGVLALGALSDRFGAGWALLTMALLGMLALALAARQWPAEQPS